MPRLNVLLDLLGEIVPGLLLAAYAVVAVGGVLVAVLAGVGWI